MLSLKFQLSEGAVGEIQNFEQKIEEDLSAIKKNGNCLAYYSFVKFYLTRAYQNFRIESS
jgi:hypothetical protein